MAMEDLRTGLDILKAVLDSAGQSQSTSDKYAQQAKMAINIEHRSILFLHEWYFAKKEKPGIITTVASDRVTVNSISGRTVTLAAALTPSRINRKFYLDATQAYYRIEAHTDNTATLTLDADYVETPTAGQGTIYQDEYNLASDCLKPWSPLRIRGQWERFVELIGEKEFRDRYGWNTTTAISIPENATMIRLDPTGQQIPRIQIAPWPSDRLNMEYDYTAIPDSLTFDDDPDDDIPMIPEPYRWVLYERALSKLFATKNDNLSERAWKRAEIGIDEMADKYIVTTTKPRFTARARFSLGVR
jgi:hypothetical protein